MMGWISVICRNSDNRQYNESEVTMSQLLMNNKRPQLLRLDSAGEISSAKYHNRVNYSSTSAKQSWIVDEKENAVKQRYWSSTMDRGMLSLSSMFTNILGFLGSSSFNTVHKLAYSSDETKHKHWLSSFFQMDRNIESDMTETTSASENGDIVPLLWPQWSLGTQGSNPWWYGTANTSRKHAFENVSGLRHCPAQFESVKKKVMPCSSEQNKVLQLPVGGCDTGSMQLVNPANICDSVHTAQTSVRCETRQVLKSSTAQSIDGFNTVVISKTCVANPLSKIPCSSRQNDHSSDEESFCNSRASNCETNPHPTIDDMETSKCRKSKKCKRPSSKKRRRNKLRLEPCVQTQNTNDSCATNQPPKLRNGAVTSKLSVKFVIQPENPKHSSHIPFSCSFAFDDDSSLSDLELDSPHDCGVLLFNSFDPVNFHISLSVSPDSGSKSKSRLARINEKWNVMYPDDVSAIDNTTPQQVHFCNGADLATVHNMITWGFAYQAARKGPWEEYARDRQRFKDRVAVVSVVIDPVLMLDHRTRMRKYVEMHRT